MKDWHRKTIGDLCHFSNGHGFTPRDWAKKGWPIIRIQNLNGSENFNYFDGEPDPSWIVEPGELLYAWAGVPGVSFGPTIWQGPRGLLNQHIYRVTPHDNIDRDWLYAALKGVTYRIERKAHGFKSSLLHVKKSDITDQHIYKPKLEEQKEIARIINIEDLYIGLTECLIAAKLERRLWLMQQLLTGMRRLPGFVHSRAHRKTPFGLLPVDWTYPRIGEIAKEISERNGDDTAHPVLSCTKHQGLVDSLAYFGKRIFSEDLSNYKLVRKGQFAYATNHIDEGSIGYQDAYDEALISPIYTVFQTDDTVDDRFLFLVLKTKTYRHIFASNTSASVDRRGSLRWSDFAKIHVPRPSIEEQQAIIKVIDTAGRELDLLRSQLTALREQKKGLMQQLLTGKLRVKV
jgi:type I restriction enzyme S subunit